MKPYVIGITGHRGVGKSSALAVFKELGAEVIDADLIVHELYISNSELIDKIAYTFGENCVKDGEVDRAVLAAVVGKDVDLLRRLNALVHPFVATAIRSLIVASDSRIIAIEAVYFERGGLYELCDFLIYIDSDRKMQFEDSVFYRLLEEFYSKERANFDLVLKNDSDFATFRQRIVEIFENLPYKR